MNIGMLWFDNDPNKKLGQKVTEAARYYRNKYGGWPTLSFVSPSMYHADDEPGVPLQLEKTVDVSQGFQVKVREHRSILPNHIWIGLEHLPQEVMTAN
jgi:hypothetical protein